MGFPQFIRREWVKAAGVVAAALVAAESSWIGAAFALAAPGVASPKESAVAAVPVGIALGIVVAVASRGAKRYWPALVLALAVGFVSVAGGLILVIGPD